MEDKRFSFLQHGGQNIPFDLRVFALRRAGCSRGRRQPRTGRPSIFCLFGRFRRPASCDRWQDGNGAGVTAGIDGACSAPCYAAIKLRGFNSPSSTLQSHPLIAVRGPPPFTTNKGGGRERSSRDCARLATARQNCRALGLQQPIAKPSAKRWSGLISCRPPPGIYPRRQVNWPD